MVIDLLHCSKLVIQLYRSTRSHSLESPKWGCPGGTLVPRETVNLVTLWNLEERVAPRVGFEPTT